MNNFCIIVPAYCEEGRVGKTVGEILPFAPNVVVVDDGSPDRSGSEAKEAGAHLITHPENRGKGAALQSGFTYAREQGFEFVITMDGDGQHDPGDIPGIIAAYRHTGCPVIIGSRMENPGSMPFVRRMTNRFMSWLLSRRIGQRVSDTQSGYRLYKTNILRYAVARSGRFAAESEILLNLGAYGVKISAAPIKVIYGSEKSKISPVRDSIRFFDMLRTFRKAEGLDA